MTRQCTNFWEISSSSGKQTYNTTNTIFLWKKKQLCVGGWVLYTAQLPSLGCFSPQKSQAIFFLAHYPLIIVLVCLPDGEKIPHKFAHHLCLIKKKKKTFISNLLYALTFFQSISSQFCFRFFPPRSTKLKWKYTAQCSLLSWEVLKIKYLA